MHGGYPHKYLTPLYESNIYLSKTEKKIKKIKENMIEKQLKLYSILYMILIILGKPFFIFI